MGVEPYTYGGRHAPNYRTQDESRYFVPEIDFACTVSMILEATMVAVEYGHPSTEASEQRHTDQVAWEIEYVGDDQAHPLTRPLSCITYGKVPPGYIETIPAQPLVPERFYVVLVHPKGGMPNLSVYFIIRADAQGRPTQLEHTNYPTDLAGIRVITQQ